MRWIPGFWLYLHAAKKTRWSQHILWYQKKQDWWCMQEQHPITTNWNNCPQQDLSTSNSFTTIATTQSSNKQLLQNCRLSHHSVQKYGKMRETREVSEEESIGTKSQNTHTSQTILILNPVSSQGFKHLQILNGSKCKWTLTMFSMQEEGIHIIQSIHKAGTIDSAKHVGKHPPQKTTVIRCTSQST